jgi:mono/diheme cytochrome c family protein
MRIDVLPAGWQQCPPSRAGAVVGLESRRGLTIGRGAHQQVMDFPIYHQDFLGNRALIGVIAVLHVYVNHALAVGAAPLITAMEWWGWRRRDQEWDRLAYRMLFVTFVVTTTVGALTGVGIWLSSSLVNPAAIGSLIRVFFWAWFSEWVVFVTEVSLILVYFLTWKRWSGKYKKRHIGIGAALSVVSWLTMAIVVAILGFMMDSGTWPAKPTFVRGVFNPIYLPQLAFRTGYALGAAGLFGLLLTFFFTRRGTALRARAIRFVSGWTLVWAPLCALGAAWYWHVIPDYMLASLPVALGTQALEGWHTKLAYIIAASAAVALVVALWGAAMPRRFPAAVLLVPFMLYVGQLGYFERVREFIRKPEVIEGYMYSNGIRKDALPLLKERGLLAEATYVPMRAITDENRLAAGREIFRIACTRCHTTRGVNSVVGKLRRLYGPPPWDPIAVKSYLGTMQNTRPYMPPFPGTDEEMTALTEYLLSLPESSAPLRGAQVVGVQVPPHGSEPGGSGPRGKGL